MKKQTNEENLIKFNRESINFANLLKCWIKLKTIDSNHFNFGLVNEKRIQLQKLLFEKGLLALDAEFLGLEQKFFYLIACLDTRGGEFRREFCKERCQEEAIDREFVHNRSTEFWLHCVQTAIQHHQTYELIKLNLTDLLAQWSRVYNELWIYNDQFQYQVWFKHKFEQFKCRIRSYQYLVVVRLVVGLFATMKQLIRARSFDKRDELLELLQTVLLQLAIEIELYFKPKLSRSKAAGHECLSSTIIKRIAYLNSKRCNLHFLTTRNVPLKRSCIDLIGCLKDGDKRSWFADLTDLGLIDVHRKLFERFTDHSYRSWFAPADDQSSFDSSVDRSVDKSIDKIYDKMYDRKFDRIAERANEKAGDKTNEKNAKRPDVGPIHKIERMVIPSKFNELVSKQQILSVSYQSLQLISSQPNSRIIDYLEKTYWNSFWFSLNFHIQHSARRQTFESLFGDEEIDTKNKTGQFASLLENIQSDFLINQMFRQFYECKLEMFEFQSLRLAFCLFREQSIDAKQFKAIKHLFFSLSLPFPVKLIPANRKEDLICKCAAYITAVCRLRADQLIRVNSERQKTSSVQFIAQIEETFNSVAKTVERVDQFTNLDQILFVLTQIEVPIKFLLSNLKPNLILFLLNP